MIEVPTMPVVTNRYTTDPAAHQLCFRGPSVFFLSLLMALLEHVNGKRTVFRLSVQSPPLFVSAGSRR